MPQDSSPHPYDCMGGWDLLGTYPNTLKDRVAPPHTALAIHGFKDLSAPSVPRVSEETIGLGQYRRPQELTIPCKSGADAITDPAEDAVDVRIYLLAVLLTHGIFQSRWERLSVQKKTHFPIMLEERR